MSDENDYFFIPLTMDEINMYHSAKGREDSIEMKRLREKVAGFRLEALANRDERMAELLRRRPLLEKKIQIPEKKTQRERKKSIFSWGKRK